MDVVGMGKRRLAALVAVVLACGAASADIRIVAPEDGATVEQHTALQKEFLALSPEARKAKEADGDYRNALAAKKRGSEPKSIELKWEGASGLVALTVTADGRTVLATNLTASSFEFRGLEIARTYRWTVAAGGESASASFTTEDEVPRLIDLPSVKNARDLGGYIGLEGRRVRQGRIFRTRAYNGDAREKDGKQEYGWKRIHEDDRIRFVEELGVRNDIDLRYDREVVGMEGSPLGEKVKWRHLPVNSYGSFGSAMSKASFKEIFRLCADPAEHGVTFHCSAGQDRTGAVAFELLALLGVKEVDLYHDWQATMFWNNTLNFNTENRFEKLLEMYRKLPGTDWTERAEAYAKSCGISEEEIERYREVMLEGYTAKCEYRLEFAPGLDELTVEEVKTHLETLGVKMKPGFTWHIGIVPKGKEGALKPEEGRYLVTEDGAWFWGEGVDGARFAFLEYLEKHCGVSWPWGFAIACPNGCRIVPAEGCVVPTVNIRTFRPRPPDVNRWHKRQMMGGHDRPLYGHAYTKYWERFGTTHPEFFAMRKDGRRLPADAKADVLNAAAYEGKRGDSISMCVSSDALVRQTIEDWKAAGAGEYVNVCENDASGQNICHCKACLALDEPPPPGMDPKWPTCYADRYIDFGNRVLAEARKVRPDAKVSFYAYNATQDPPRRVRPADGVVLGIVPVDFRWDSITNYVGAWKRAGLRNFFCRPNRHCYYECPWIPLGNQKHFFKLWKYLHEQGCVGLDDSAAKYKSRYEWLGDYAILKCMRDPSKDYDHWERLYCSSFGAAADDVRAYYRYWREEVWEKRLEPDLGKLAEKGRWFNVARGIMWSMGDYYREEDYRTAGACLDRAYARATTDESRALVDELRLSHEHARLFFRAVTTHNRQDKLPKEKKNFAAAQALRAFREKHGYALVPWNEGYFGDVCDMMALTGLPRPTKNVDEDDRLPAPPGPEGWKFREELAREAPPEYPAPQGTPWLENRISRCFFSPIKRPPFNRDELKDDIDYYPDNYLERLRREGVNGLWLSVVLDDLDEPSFAKLRRTVGKCAAHGVKVWAFAIEPRSRPHDDPFFAAHPDARGSVSWDGRHVNCPSSPAALADLEAKVARLFRAVPDLAGMINIANGERSTTCLSFARTTEDEPKVPCARCSRRAPWELYAAIADAMVKGMRTVNPQAKLITWFYHPKANPKRGRWVMECARHVPDGAVLQYNFESGAERVQAGKRRCGGDYWLSVPGPAEPFRTVSAAARSAGRALGAKIQTSCSHECATVPYVPVPGLLYRKFRGMREAGVRDVMMCWFFGNAPGLMNHAAGRLAYEDFADGEAAFLERLAKDEWGEDAAVVGGLWKKFSDAYSHYPLSNSIQYYGPFHAGFSWPLYPSISMRSLQRTWKPLETPGGDLLGEALQEFSLEDALSCAGEMVKELDGVRPVLDGLRVKYAADRTRRRDLGIMVTLMNLFESGRDIFRFYLLRREAVFASRLDGDSARAQAAAAEMQAILAHERALAEEMIPLCDDDSRLGFHSEAEAHQFTAEYLRWRNRRIAAAEEELKGIVAELKAGRPWPESARERSAVVIDAEETADGSVVISGTCPELADGQEMELRTYDLCGTTTARVHAVHPTNGTFRVAIPPSDWRNDRRLKPAWAVIRQGRDYNNGGTTWALPDLPMFPEPRLIQSALTGDNFARLRIRRPCP